MHYVAEVIVLDRRPVLAGRLLLGHAIRYGEPTMIPARNGRPG
jgi:hypothetical protein